jgi:hypothetical protein
MSRAFVRESEIEAPEQLPDRLISTCPNDVTAEGMKQLELMFESAREAHAAALRAQDRSALEAFHFGGANFDALLVAAHVERAFDFSDRS